MLISQIKPNPNNPRKIDKIEFDKLVKSIEEDKEFLNAKPLVIDENNVLLAGNMRYKACVQLGIQDVPVVILSNLTEQKKKKFLIIDNTHNGTWDMDILANEQWELNDLEEWGVNVDFLLPSIEEPKSIDNTKKDKLCPNCGVSL